MKRLGPRAGHLLDTRARADEGKSHSDAGAMERRPGWSSRWVGS